MSVASADGKQNGSRQPANRGNNEKCRYCHVTQPHDVAQAVLRESGDEKEDEGDKDPAVFHDVVVFFDNIRFYYPFHKRKAKYPGKEKSKPRTDGEADGGIDRAHEGAIEVTADEAGDFSRYRGCYNLQDLKEYENKLVIRMIGIDEGDRLLLVDKIDIEVIMKKTIGSKSNQDEE